VLIRREGWRVNHPRIYRLHKEEGLNLRSKRPRRWRCAVNRLVRVHLTAPNQVWSMDFVSDALFNGKKFRALTIVDNHTRECLAIEVNPSLTGDHVVEVLQAFTQQGRPLPSRIQADKGPEFVSIILDKWAYDNDVVLYFSRPGKPTDNPFIEAFNGRFRGECLNVHWFLSLEDSSAKMEVWRQDYNYLRPHSSLPDAAPALFASQFKGSTNGRNL
jgi:putative transposase